MKTKGALVLIVLLFITCSKENISNKQQAGESNNITAVLDTVKIPLNDLGVNTYRGNTGGLFPGGVNEPTGTYAADLLNVSNSIIPIDSSGTPNSKRARSFLSLWAVVPADTI